MNDRSKELGTVFLLLMPLLFLLGEDSYLPYVSSIIFLFVFQGFLSWFLLFKVGQFYFGYSVTMALGAYATIVLTEKFLWPIWASGLIGCFMAMLLNVLVFFATIRARGFYVGMVSFLMCLLFPMVIEGLRELTGGRSGMFFDGWGVVLGEEWMFVIIVLATAALAAGLFLFIRTKTGAILTLISQNDDLTKTVGINTTWYKALAYALAGFFSGLGGFLYVNFNGTISSVDIDAFTTVYIYFIPLLGGRKVPYGPLIGALIIKLTPELFTSLERYLGMIMGLVFVAVIIFLPDGLGSLIDKALNRIFKRKPQPTGAKGLR